MTFNRSNRDHSMAASRQHVDCTRQRVGPGRLPAALGGAEKNKGTWTCGCRLLRFKSGGHGADRCERTQPAVHHL